MHREISHTDSLHDHESNTPLYLLTGLLALLLGLDLFWYLQAWMGDPSRLPEPYLVFGIVQLSMIAAVLGGARVLYVSLLHLFEGKLGADFALAIACVAAIFLREP